MSRACFYLVGSTIDNIGDGHVAVLPNLVTFASLSRQILCGVFTDTQHDEFLATFTQPEGWTGQVGATKRLMRENDLIAYWWLFSAFLELNGIRNVDDYRQL